MSTQISQLPSQMRSSIRLLVILSLIALSMTVFLGKSYENLLRGIDSNIHAKVSLNVTDQGFLPHLPMKDVNPHLDGSPTVFNDHPFFLLWINGIIMRTLGPSGWSARLLPAIFSTGCVLLVFYLGFLLETELFGFISALLFLFTRDIILTGASNSLDPPLLFFILLSFIFWKKQNWLGVGLACGFGLWIKTPVVLLIFPTSLFLMAIQYRFKTNTIPNQFSKQIKGWIIAVLLACLLGVLIWCITGFSAGWSWVEDYWVRQVFGTAVGGRGSHTWANPWMFFNFVKRGFIPGLPLLFISIVTLTWKKQWKQPAPLTSFIAICIAASAITLVRARMEYYYNPTFPFLAFIAAFQLYHWCKSVELKVYFGFLGVVPIVLAFLLCTPTELGPESFVALKRFIPFIQSYGSCQSRILLIAGGEPIGSAVDYQLVLNFYADRPVIHANCNQADNTVKQAQPEWIIGNQQILRSCLSQKTLDLFPSKIQMGDQILMTSLMPHPTIIDLTVLERELKPAFDCHPAAYPVDRYHRYPTP